MTNSTERSNCSRRSVQTSLSRKGGRRHGKNVVRVQGKQPQNTPQQQQLISQNVAHVQTVSSSSKPSVYDGLSAWHSSEPSSMPSSDYDYDFGGGGDHLEDIREQAEGRTEVADQETTVVHLLTAPKRVRVSDLYGFHTTYVSNDDRNQHTKHGCHCDRKFSIVFSIPIQ